MVSPTLISFLSSTLSTVLGGVVLAILFFWSREKWFSLPSISGRWHLEMRTVETAYNPYKGMVLRYVAMLWREGLRSRAPRRRSTNIPQPGSTPTLANTEHVVQSRAISRNGTCQRIRYPFISLRTVTDASPRIFMPFSSTRRMVA